MEEGILAKNISQLRNLHHDVTNKNSDRMKDKFSSSQNNQMKLIEIKLLETSLFSVTMLLNLINDMLDLAKMENSKFNLNESYFNLNTIIFEVFDMIKFFTDQKN